MSKPNNAALNLHDLFSDDNVDREHGDKAGQGPIALKSDSTSAAAPQPSHAAATDAASRSPAPASLLSVTMCFDNYGNCCTAAQTVDPTGTVTLKYNVSGSRKVTTTPSNAFLPTGDYYATYAGCTYTLKSGISGTITLDAGGTNGTINVGGGNSCPPCDDEGQPNGPSRSRV